MSNSDTICRPRYATTRRPDWPTYGHEVEADSLILTGHRFLPWQRQIADVANEYDPDTGLLFYDTVVIVVPRQNGKTTYIEAGLVHASRRGPDRTVVYTAQDRQMSRRRLLDELEVKRLARSPVLAGRYKARRSNGSEEIRWLDLNSVITTTATTDEAGHGMTLDKATIDEAFAHHDLTMVSALTPTMATRPDPQLEIVSTVGDGSDGLLLHYQDVGATSIADPDTRVAYFEWSADTDDDLDDPAVWARIMPAFGRTIAADRLRSFRQTLTVDVFDRAFGCRRPTVAQTAGLDLDLWQLAADTFDPSPPLVAAVHVSLDRSYTSIAVAGAHPDNDGRVGVIIDRRPGVAWIPDELKHLIGLGLVAVCADRRAGAGGIIDRAAGHGIDIDELVAADVASFCGTLIDELAEHGLAHSDHADLNAAATGSKRRPLGDSFAWNARESIHDIAPLAAATYAVGMYRRLYPVGAVVERIR